MDSQTFERVKNKNPCFFLGANGGNGFVNYFDRCYLPEENEKLYIIKGGPGTGKSTFMKNIILDLTQRNMECELYFCSSDPGSLDGVRFPGMGVAFVDGTSPHVVEPKMLGITEEIINLGEFLHTQELNKEQIIPLYRQHAAFHKKTSRYLGAASRLMDDSYAVACKCCNFEKVEEVALRFCREFFTDKKKKGKEYKRFLSGFTPLGYVLLEETLSHYADTILAIDDEYGAVSSVFLSLIRQQALSFGYTIYVCSCALSSGRKIDHVIIPELQLAFCTTNWFMPITVDTSRRIHAKRFYDAAYMGEHKQRLRFNRRATEELFDGAYYNLKEAKEVHDALENHYIKAMDFTGCEHKASEVLTKLFAE